MSRQWVTNSSVAGNSVFSACKDNLNNMNQGAVSVAERFLDTAITTSKRMLNAAPIGKALEEMGAMSAEIFTPFDSHSLLQSLMNKA
eukprot:5432305-Lingulodinium_polyedra.AAC.1